jgi:hypothetical protein
VTLRDELEGLVRDLRAQLAPAPPPRRLADFSGPAAGSGVAVAAGSRLASTGTTPQAIGAAPTGGTSNEASRADHVHGLDDEAVVLAKIAAAARPRLVVVGRTDSIAFDVNRRWVSLAGAAVNTTYNATRHAARAPWPATLRRLRGWKSAGTGTVGLGVSVGGAAPTLEVSLAGADSIASDDVTTVNVDADAELSMSYVRTAGADTNSAFGWSFEIVPRVVA